ncbi:hypothetical protein GC105_16285 [Alkalibaculum sp. M08DMB]|uniref:Bacterial transcription activator effector binding domain-containing protein n=1 Tax=Alkalibaculum sporogenes TaxID=2655001 RepID=A0A6A7KD94_9FIRM|nr:hypothetical protein [Alkalibaculum sporogenes]MPW27325.1 hypothetical protein [Alkalibaculum sporogenes]
MLEIKTDKILKLNGYLMRELRNLPQIEVDKATYMMESFIKTNKIIILGPLITVTYDSHIDEKEGLLVNIDLIMQVKSIPSISEPYQYIPSGLKLSNCIYVRFEGNIQELSYGYTKLNLYIWENKLIKAGPIYTVYANMENPENVTVDIFIPVEET